ncbi:60S ribosomal protein L37 [Hibiscus syriacus]|uniref:60S ribosomal protein L37 n=1 Tax=Hibiscus syriacus TaxID=106335 RepID=A0A6A2WTU0_HIBSY|nr:60S ribosomal protein L37 [Hibiscus syriacus]
MEKLTPLPAQTPKWGKELEALEKEGIRRIPFAFGVDAVASISRRAVAVLVPTLPAASENKDYRTGRMRYLRHVPRWFKTGFREGTQATPRKKATVIAA